jgi:hypothetical protein
MGTAPKPDAEATPFRLFVWDAGDQAGGVAHAQEEAQRALVAALSAMAPGTRGRLRTASLDIAAGRKSYDYGETLMTGVRTPFGVRLVPA